MGAVRRLRAQTLAEDAGDDCEVFAIFPDVPDDDEWDSFVPDYDALAHAVPPESTWPRWWCDECDQLNEGPRWTCAMCGTVRGDADAL